MKENIHFSYKLENTINIDSLFRINILSILNIRLFLKEPLNNYLNATVK